MRNEEVSTLFFSHSAFTIHHSYLSNSAAMMFMLLSTAITSLI
jgi:hypothetical protein